MNSTKKFSIIAVVFIVALLPVAVMGQADSTIFLPVITGSGTAVPDSPSLTPFDANLSDLAGPSSWSTNYGKTPEIIVSSNGSELDVLAQDYDSETAWNAVLLHIEPDSSGGYKITQALTDIPMLDRVMGLANDGAGNRFYATGVDGVNT